MPSASDKMAVNEKPGFRIICRVAKLRSCRRPRMVSLAEEFQGYAVRGLLTQLESHRKEGVRSLFSMRGAECRITKTSGYASCCPKMGSLLKICDCGTASTLLEPGPTN